MFDRVVVDVVDMPLPVLFITDDVLPEPTLPDTALTLAQKTLTPVHRHSYLAGKVAFDTPQPVREITVAIW